MSISLMVTGMLCGAQATVYGVYFSHLYLEPAIRKMVRAGKSKPELPFEVMISRHAQGDFSDEFDEEPKPINKTSNLKSHAVFAIFQALALAATCLVYQSGQNDKLPPELEEFDRKPKNNILSMEEWWDIIDENDLDKNGKLSVIEARKINTLSKTLGEWGENQSTSKQNFNFASGLVSDLNGNIPPKDMRR